MDYIFFVYSINFVHKSLHYWTGDCFKNNRRSLLMKTKSTINLFATALLTSAILGSAHSVFADAQIVRHTEDDSIEIISDPYKTFAEADKALNEVKDKYLEEYGNYRAGVIPTEDLKNYEVYAIIHAVSRDEHSKSTTQNVAKFLTNGQSSTPAKPVEERKLVTPTKPAEEGKPVTPAKPVEEVKPVTPAKPVKEVKPVTPTKPTEEVKHETPTKPTEEVQHETPAKTVDEGKTSNDIKKIDGEFTEIKTTSTGLTFKAKLYEELPHDGPYTPNIHATLTDKATGKEVAKTGVVLEGLSEGLKKADALFYANLLEGIIFEPSLTPGNYVLTVKGTAGATYGQNTDKRKRHFVFSTEVTLTGENNTTTITQPEKPKDSTTKSKSDQTINNVNNNQQPSNDKNKQITNNNTGKQDKNELITNKTSDTKTDKQNSDNTLSQEKQQTTSTSTTKPENNKNNDKKTLPNTGESTSILGIIGTILSITSLGFIVKRKRG